METKNKITFYTIYMKLLKNLFVLFVVLLPIVSVLILDRRPPYINANWEFTWTPEGYPYKVWNPEVDFQTSVDSIMKKPDAEEKRLEANNTEEADTTTESENTITLESEKQPIQEDTKK